MTLAYSCRHDARGRPLGRYQPGQLKAARQVDGQCPQCKRDTQVRAEAEARERARLARLAVSASRPPEPGNCSECGEERALVWSESTDRYFCHRCWSAAV